MTTQKTEVHEKLAVALWNARSMSDVKSIQRMAEEIYGDVGTRPVGDRPNNIGTVRLGSDPALGVVERITNAMDATLELGHRKNPTDDPQSPIEAAYMWYGVPQTGLADMTEKERRALGENLRVWLDESGDDKRPTVGTEDRGLGQTKVAMPMTILSLNEQNKPAQKWSMGTYGQGGAVTYGFSEATIIISRRHPDFLDGEPDRVAWTVVREYDAAPETGMLPNYQYLVGRDNEVFDLDPALFPDLDHGTRIIHIGYDLQGWTGPFTTGLWQFLHSALFDPVLPFLITGYRKKENTYGDRIIIGNAARLSRPDKARGELDVVHTDSTRLDLGGDLGAVKFEYWVLQRPAGSKSKTDPAAGYVKPDSAVSITLFGQRQDTESRVWIKGNAMLPFLYKNMVVQVDANELTAIGKRELFAATRERATKSDLRHEIYDKLAVVLRNDEELKRLNHIEKERVLQKSTSASSEKVRKRLAKFIKTKLKERTRQGTGGTDTGPSGRKKSGGGGSTSPGRDTDDSHLGNVPTKLVIERDKIRLYQGAGAYSWVEIDAKNGYLPEHDDDLSLEWIGDQPGDKVRIVMRSKLLGGKSRWFFEADTDADIGEYVMRASLLTANGILSDETTIQVEKAPDSKSNSRGTEPDTGPRVEWVYKENWDDHDDMGPHRVGYVTEDDEETIIFVNRHYVVLDKALSGRGLTEASIDTRATRYQYPVACALWLQHDAAKRAEAPPTEEYQQAENERMAEAVIVAIDPDVDAAMEEGED